MEGESVEKKRARAAHDKRSLVPFGRGGEKERGVKEREEKQSRR